MSDLVPYCVYKQLNEEGGSIFLPVKQRQDDKDIFVCKEKQGLELMGVFYAINPAFRPIPYSTSLMCEGKNGVEFVYDPFNIDEKCIRFIAWVTNVPNTIPLYLGKKGGIVFVSFTPFSTEYEHVPYSPIHVVPGDKGDFLFKNRNGICYPDSTGLALRPCLESNLSAPSILDLVKRESARKRYLPFYYLLLLLAFFVLMKINGIHKKHRR